MRLVEQLAKGTRSFDYGARRAAPTDMTGLITRTTGTMGLYASVGQIIV